MTLLLLRRRRSLRPVERPEVDRVVLRKDVREHRGRGVARRRGTPYIEPELRATTEGKDRIPRVIPAGDLPCSVPIRRARLALARPGLRVRPEPRRPAEARRHDPP